MSARTIGSISARPRRAAAHPAHLRTHPAGVMAREKEQLIGRLSPRQPPVERIWGRRISPAPSRRRPRRGPSRSARSGSRGAIPTPNCSSNICSPRSGSRSRSIPTTQRRGRSAMRGARTRPGTCCPPSRARHRPRPHPRGVARRAPRRGARRQHRDLLDWRPVRAGDSSIRRRGRFTPSAAASR